MQARSTLTQLSVKQLEEAGLLDRSLQLVNRDSVRVDEPQKSEPEVAIASRTERKTKGSPPQECDSVVSTPASRNLCMRASALTEGF